MNDQNQNIDIYIFTSSETWIRIRTHQPSFYLEIPTEKLPNRIWVELDGCHYGWVEALKKEGFAPQDSKNTGGWYPCILFDRGFPPAPDWERWYRM